MFAISRSQRWLRKNNTSIATMSATIATAYGTATAGLAIAIPLTVPRDPVSPRDGQLRHLRARTSGQRMADGQRLCLLGRTCPTRRWGAVTKGSPMMGRHPFPGSGW